MKIVYDHQTYSLQEYGGISRYFTELIKGINKQAKNCVYLPILFSNNIYLYQENIISNRFFPQFNFYKKIGILHRINCLFSILYISVKSYDIFHATYYYTYFVPYVRNKPFVITIHDMIFEKFADDFKELKQGNQIVENKRILAQRADAIIAVSHSTKRDIIELLNIDPKKVFVVYHGSSLTPIKPNPAKVIEPYLLYVGNRGHYKNFTKFLQAIVPLLKTYNISLVCAGGGLFNLEERLLIQSLDIEYFVKQQSVDSDRTLSDLYQSARAFVFPSLYEGFGIPILEAFACQCACVLSNTSSLPEVAGDAAIYFDPNSTESIRDSVELIMSDEKLRTQLIALGNQRLTKFSWADSVKDTLQVYETCLGRSGRK